MLGVARGIRAGLRIRWVAPRRVGTGQPWWRRPMSSATALRDVNDAANTLGEALRELEMLADEEGDGGVSTLPGPISARHELVAERIQQVLEFCGSEAEAVGEWDGQRRGQPTAYKHHATVAPLHAQALLALGKARLVLPPPFLDVGGALQLAEHGFGALRALLDSASAPPEGRAAASALAATRAARVHMLRGALQLSATRMRYAAEVEPAAWPPQGRAVIELLRELLPDFVRALPRSCVGRRLRR